MQDHAVMTAAKSRFGHSETGAGALGLFLVVRRMMSQAALPLTHLRNLNPHLQPIVESPKAPRLALPRQEGPTAAGQDHGGISSFAFQVRKRAERALPSSLQSPEARGISFKPACHFHHR